MFNRKEIPQSFLFSGHALENQTKRKSEKHWYHIFLPLI